MKNNRARADDRIVADPNGAEQNRVRADIDVVPDDRTVRKAVPHANRCAMSNGAIAAEDCSFMHDQTCPMIKSQSGADLRLEIEFDAKSPFDVEEIEYNDRSSQPTKRRMLSLNSLGGTVKEQRTAALPIPDVCPPILKDPGFHLPSGSFMEFHFYLPERYLPNSDRQEAWEKGKITSLEPAGKIASAQAWIYRTWLALNQTGFPAQLTSKIPSDGVLVTLSGCVSKTFRIPGSVFLADIVADHVPSASAHLHIVQNSAQVRRLWNSIFMPHWPQPNLLSRDPARGARFENVHFFGDTSNLAPELREAGWRKRLLRELGVEFVICGADRWHDYSETDCVAAVRGFGSSAYLHKPATKLYNAWLAGVPFIGGTDSAYAADGEAGRNFLRAATPEELFAHIRRLKEEPALRDRLVSAGRAAGKDFTSEAILGRWTALLGDTVQRLAERWQRKGAAARRIFFASQTASVWLDTRLRR